VESSIRSVLDKSPEVGFWDGHEFGDGRAVIFLYGHDSMALRETVEEILFALDLEYAATAASDEHTPTTVEDMYLLTVRRARQSH